jgi:endonuclease-3
MPKTAPAKKPAKSATSPKTADVKGPGKKAAKAATSPAGTATKKKTSNRASTPAAKQPAKTARASSKAAPAGRATAKTAGVKSPRRAATADAPVKERSGAQMKPAQIQDMFARLQALNPAPTTELEYTTPYELLVAVALSAQSTDVGVNKATRKLFPIANTPRQIAALGVEGLKPYIATIGLFNTKAANVVALSQQLLDLHGGEVPRDRAALEALPGVGRKTANVVLNTAFGEPTIAVDTHIFRVSNRTGLAPGKDVLAVEHKLLKVVPDAYLQDAHHWLILHGRYVCKARKPDCPHCAIRDLCRFPDKTPGEPDPVAA